MTNQSAKEQATTGRFRKKPVIVEAVQWFKLGQHPAVLAAPLQPIDGYIVGTHGWIQTLEGGHIVSPGDWIITGIQGEHYPCKPDIFEATYEPVTQAARASSPVAPNHASSLLPLWNDAYTAFKGAFDSPMMRRKIDDEFSADARKRLRDFDEALRASPVAIHEGWQPIETVPKDSKSRLVYCPDRGNTYLVFWDKVVGEWRHVGGGGVLNQWDYPTHWMPLPQDPGASAPPSPGAAQGMEPVAELRQDGKGGGYVHWLSEQFFDVGTKLYTSPPASPAPAREALNNLIEQIAVEWDGCEFDAPGGMIDIGDAIRRKGLPLVAALSPSSPGAQTHTDQSKEN